MKKYIVIATLAGGVTGGYVYKDDLWKMAVTALVKKTR
jgi:hypothetical protein